MLNQPQSDLFEKKPVHFDPNVKPSVTPNFDLNFTNTQPNAQLSSQPNAQLSNQPNAQLSNQPNAKLSALMRRPEHPGGLQAASEIVIPLGNDEYLPALSRWTTLGGLVLLAALAGGVGLAAVTPSPVVVRSPAIVRPQGELRVVQATADGIIQSIQVEQGQDLKAGQTLAILDDRQLQTRQRQLEGSIQQNQMQLQQLQVQIGNLAAQKLAEQSLTERGIAAAQAELRRVERERLDREAIAQKEVQEAEALAAAAEAEAEAYQEAAEAGVLPRIQAENKRQSYLAAQARLERVQTGLNPDRSSIAQSQENLAQVAARGDSTVAALERQRASLVQQQAEIRQRLVREEQELKQLVHDADDRTIRAPLAGNLLQLNLRNEGQVVRPGEVIAQIFPADAELVIKAQVMPQDIGKVEVGQAVSMRVSAYSYADYGTLKGTVVAIASDTAASSQGSGSPGGAPGQAAPASFEITIRPEQDFLLKGDRPHKITPGMEIQADIVAKEETVLTLMLRKARLLSGV